MKIFLDSSKIEEAKKWMPIIDGATTNPSILLKDGSNIYKFAEAMEPLPVSIEACGNFESDAQDYAYKIPNAVIKIPLLNPAGDDNLAIIKQLSDKGFKINCTALMSLSQVILAQKAKATYASLFTGRVGDEGGNPIQMMQDCMNYLKNAEEYEVKVYIRTLPRGGHTTTPFRQHSDTFLEPIPISYRTKLIVGSIRTVGNVLDAVKAGVHIVTIPPAILEKMVMHRYSLDTVKQFERDNKKISG